MSCIEHYVGMAAETAGTGATGTAAACGFDAKIDGLKDENDCMIELNAFFNVSVGTACDVAANKA